MQHSSLSKDESLRREVIGPPGRRGSMPEQRPYKVSPKKKNKPSTAPSFSPLATTLATNWWERVWEKKFGQRRAHMGYPVCPMLSSCMFVISLCSGSLLITFFNQSLSLTLSYFPNSLYFTLFLLWKFFAVRERLGT